MTNEAALAILEVKRSAVNSAINGLHQYINEAESWKASVATAKMSEIKSNGTAVGADIAAWDGSSAD